MELKRTFPMRILRSKPYFGLKKVKGCDSQNFWHSSSDNEAQNESIVNVTNQFVSDHESGTCRRPSVALAEFKLQLVLLISQEQIDEVRECIHMIKCPITFEREQEVSHGIMVHFYAFCDQ
jgi:hypothetical protein